MKALRGAFFAQAGESASRYGVRFERVLVHLWQGRQHHRCVRLRNIIYLDDLVHAIACLDNDSLAWADLVERFERSMVRRCRASHDEITSTILVRRVFADIRRECVEQVAGTTHRPALAQYVGHRPLRRWLSDRLMEARNRANMPPQWCRHVRPIPALKNGTCDSPWTANLPVCFANPRFQHLSSEEVAGQRGLALANVPLRTH